MGFVGNKMFGIWQNMQPLLFVNREFFGFDVKGSRSF